MGAGEVPAGRTRRTPTALACLAALALLAGCGNQEGDQQNISEAATLGPTSAEGDVETTPATLRSEDGYTTLATSQITTRGNADTLIAAQVELRSGGTPDLRLKVDDKTEQDAEVDVTSSGGERVALVSCACQVATGDHDIALEGTSQGSETVGARTLVAFSEVQLDEDGGSPISGSALVTDETTVDSEGVTLAETSTEGGSGGGDLIVIAPVAVPRTGTGNENVRIEVEIGGDVSDQVSKTSIPSGKLDAYLDDDGAGKDVVVRGYTTAGETKIGVASILACNCGIAR